MVIIAEATRTVTYCSSNYSRKNLLSHTPGACIINHYLLVIYSKRIDLIVSQCLFYNQSQKHKLGQGHKLAIESLNYESVMSL
jgi:hypothetical protein